MDVPKTSDFHPVTAEHHVIAVEERRLLGHQPVVDVDQLLGGGGGHVSAVAGAGGQLLDLDQPQCADDRAYDGCKGWAGVLLDG